MEKEKKEIWAGIGVMLAGHLVTGVIVVRYVLFSLAGGWVGAINSFLFLVGFFQIIYLFPIMLVAAIIRKPGMVKGAFAVCGATFLVSLATYLVDMLIH